MSKKIIAGSIFITFIVIYVFVAKSKSNKIDYKAWLTNTCEIAQPTIKVELELLWTALSFQKIKSITYIGIKGEQKEYIKTDYSGSFNTPKIIFLARSGDSYQLELLNSTSCALMKHFGDGQDHVLVDLLSNPWPYLKQIFINTNKVITIGDLKQLGFSIIERNENTFILHTYPALSVSVEVKPAQNCKDNCEDLLEVVAVKNIFSQLVVEDDAGNVVSKTEPVGHGLNKQDFPVLLTKIKAIQ